MNMIELIEEFDRHPPSNRDLRDAIILTGIGALYVLTCTLILGDAEYQSRHPPELPVIRVELTPQSTLNLASVLADIQADRGFTELVEAVH